MLFRDQFVGNTGPGQRSESVPPLNLVQSQPYTWQSPYSPLDSRPPNPHGPSYPDASFLHPRNRPYGSSKDSVIEQYEMGPWNNRAVSDEHPDSKNPFVISQTPTNVFEDPPSNTSHDIFHDESMEKRKRNNEIARRKLERRLPRFHLTKLPYFTILVTLIQVAVFIAELAKMASLTGSAFQTKPYFNPMLGPSTYLLIHMGARYVPCMHKFDQITTDTSIQFPCANSTSIDTNVCSLPELCGLGKIPTSANDGYLPDQWYRLITPMFLHAGFLHIGFNLLLQVSMGASMERAIGWLKYAMIYLSSGIAGFLLGANFAPAGIASTGASGALFGIIAANLLLFIYSGRKNTNIYGTKHYGLFIFILLMEVVVSFVLGLLPGMDNFSHIGGFCMGLLTLVLLLPDPAFVYIDGIYTYYPDTTTMGLFLSNWNPLNKIDDKVLWKLVTWSGVRVVCLVLAILYFVLLLKNLYSADMTQGNAKCKWCKYINCIPVHGWCNQGEVSVQNVDENGNGNEPSDSSVSPLATPLSSPPDSTMYSLMTYTSPGKTVEETGANGNNGPQPLPTNGNYKRDFGTFADPANQIHPDSFNPGVQLTFIIVMSVLTVSFWNRRH